MCQIMEELNAKAAEIATKRTSLQIASNMLAGKKLSLEDVAKYSNLTLDEVKNLAKENSKLNS